MEIVRVWTDKQCNLIWSHFVNQLICTPWWAVGTESVKMLSCWIHQILHLKAVIAPSSPVGARDDIKAFSCNIYYIICLISTDIFLQIDDRYNLEDEANTWVTFPNKPDQNTMYSCNEPDLVRLDLSVDAMRESSKSAYQCWPLSSVQTLELVDTALPYVISINNNLKPQLTYIQHHLTRNETAFHLLQKAAAYWSLCAMQLRSSACTCTRLHCMELYSVTEAHGWSQGDR